MISPLPKSIRRSRKRDVIKSFVVKWIHDNKLADGEMIVSETQLAAICEVTPLTAHRALSELAEEGVVHRVKGNGTFVGKAPKMRGVLQVAMILPEANAGSPANNPDHWHIVQSVIQAFARLSAGEVALTTLVVSPAGNQMEKTARHLCSYDAVFFFGGREFAPLIEQLAKKNTPQVIIFSDNNPQAGRFSINTDRFEGVRRGVLHLVEHGCQRIAFIGSPPEDVVSDDRKFSGYQQALSDAGLPSPDNLVVRSAVRQCDGARGAAQLCDSAAVFDAIFVDTDIKAAGVIEYLRSKDIRVPGEVAVMGYDGLKLYQVGPPYLASVRTPVEEMIAAVIHEIRSPLPNRNIARRIEMVGEVVPGKTCGCRMDLEGDGWKSL